MDLQEQLSSRIKQATETVEGLEQIVKYRPTIALFKGKPLTSLNIDELREEVVLVSMFLNTYGRVFDAASIPKTIVYQGVDAQLLVRTLFSLIDKHESALCITGQRLSWNKRKIICQRTRSWSIF
jgi:hypothetical protein